MSDYEQGAPWEASQPAPSIPANLEAERAVLGSLLIDPEAIGKVADLLAPGDFFREKHSWLYQAMLSLYERQEPIDPAMLNDQLERDGRLAEIGGPGAITDLMIETPTAFYVLHYAHIVKRAATNRALISAAQHIAEVAYSDRETAEAIDLAEQALYRVSSRAAEQDELEPLGNHVNALLDQIEERKLAGTVFAGVPSGFTFLDRLLGGFHPGGLYTIAGRPGMGKTSFATSIALNASRQYGARVGIFSIEMSTEELTNRVLSMVTGIDSFRLRMGNVQDAEWDLLLSAANELSRAPLYITDQARTLSEIRTKARRRMALEGLDMLIIDYLQLMVGIGQHINRVQEVSQITLGLKHLARELKIPILALSQLSRAVEQRSDKKPILSDLRESGTIEQDSDGVLFIHREDYYDDETERQNIADIIVAKHRHGATGTVSLYFRKELTQFRDLEINRVELNGDEQID